MAAPLKTERTQPAFAQAATGIAATERDPRDMRALDVIHTIFLFYSGAHNAVNAWVHAEGFFFLAFVLAGILSVELMLWAIYKYWKSGRLVGKMLSIGKLAGAVALFYATAGILAETQSAEVSGWLLTYYQWILPTSAPMMFLFAFWIQSADPIMTMERDTIAMEHSLSIETKRVKLDTQRLKIKAARTKREAEYALVSRQWDMIRKHIQSVRTGWRLNGKARQEVRHAVAGIEADFQIGGLLKASNPEPIDIYPNESGGDGQAGNVPFPPG